MRRVLVILLVISSCSVSNRKIRTEPLHFFACNKWIDRNKDGIYDYYEFENIKTTFRASEVILFIGFFNFPPPGSKLRFRLFAPDGSLVHEFTQAQLFKGTLLHSEYRVTDLITGYSAGVWDGVWDVEDEVVAETQVNLIY